MIPRGHRYAGAAFGREEARHFGGSPSAPKSPAAPPTKTDAQVQAELAAQRAATRNRRGFSSTILTGDAGLGSGGAGKTTLGG